LQLREHIAVSPRYARSVNVERDGSAPGALDGYVLTSTARNCVERIIHALQDRNGQRAWTLTGPYGTGKSAFAVYLSKVLGPASEPAAQAARTLTKKQAPDLYRSYFERRKSEDACCVISICGAQEPILPLVVDAACRDFSRYAHSQPAKSILKQLGVMRRKLQGGEPVSSTNAVELISRLAQQLYTDRSVRHTVIVIDELGKFLDFAAASPETGDVFLLQQLAEASSPVEGGKLAIVTILHQSFDRYASNLRATVRDEWAKIQGRFEDVAFQEPPEQLLTLIAMGIAQRQTDVCKRLRQRAGQIAEVLFRLRLAPRNILKADFVQLMQECAPLHPLTVLALVRLCRKLGQNQRSLFSFLVSREPNGFTQFLEAEVPGGEVGMYGLDNLYDYIAESFGESLTIGESGTRWAAAQNALDRAVDCSHEEMRLLKAVGVMNAIGVSGEFKPTPDVLRVAADVPTGRPFAALSHLVERSLLIERKFNGTVGLWDGSDIDLDERLRDAASHLPETAAVAQSLQQFSTPRPMVAKRHSFRVGTLRYFAVSFADVTTPASRFEVPDDADGLLVFCLPNGAEDCASLQLKALSHSASVPGLIFALPKDVDSLREALRQLELLRWVEANTPALQSDAVARKEIRSRVSWMSARLSAEIGKLFQPSSMSARQTQWIHSGKVSAVDSERRLSELLSSVCDSVYTASPIIQNELLNRRNLSSAAAAARRTLISAMVTRGSVARLGFEGNPPELSMYRTVLEDTGIHRYRDGIWQFCSPEPTSSLYPVWQEFESFLDSGAESRRNVAAIYQEFGKHPYGMKMGVLPVLLWAFLLANDTEIALYEDNIFTPELTIEAVERMLRSPQKFELRRYRISGIRKEVFARMGQILNASMRSDKANLVELMRPLYRFFHRLPAYTRQTKRLSATAIAIRQALSDAREPDVLLFSDLPTACGFTPFTSDSADHAALTAFLGVCRATLMELQQTYENLIADLRSLIFEAMGVTGGDARAVLRLQAEDVFTHSVEPRLRGFSHNLADDMLEDSSWAESVSTMIIGKVPKAWTDNDRARFDVSLSELARSFRQTLVLVRERQVQRQRHGDEAETMRLSVLDLTVGETAEVISILPGERDEWARTIVRLRESVSGHLDGENPKLIAAALGFMLKESIEKLRESSKQAAPTPLAHGNRKS
jgi:hypothetical protein